MDAVGLNVDSQALLYTAGTTFGGSCLFWPMSITSSKSLLLALYLFSAFCGPLKAGGCGADYIY